MRKISSKSSDKDSFKYSILISLHSYDISFHPEKVSKLKPFKTKYNFNHTEPKEFEINNPNISLIVFDENDKVAYMSKNNNINKVQIVKINNHKYAAIKPLRNKFVNLNKILESFSHIKLREYILQNILNKIEETEFKA